MPQLKPGAAKINKYFKKGQKLKKEKEKQTKPKKSGRKKIIKIRVEIDGTGNRKRVAKINQ